MVVIPLNYLFLPVFQGKLLCARIHSATSWGCSEDLCLQDWKVKWERGIQWREFMEYVFYHTGATIAVTSMRSSVAWKHLWTTRWDFSHSHSNPHHDPCSFFSVGKLQKGPRDMKFRLVAFPFNITTFWLPHMYVSMDLFSPVLMSVSEGRPLSFLILYFVLLIFEFPDLYLLFGEDLFSACSYCRINVPTFPPSLLPSI